jgi:carboxymethylenebutenolidase
MKKSKTRNKNRIRKKGSSTKLGDVFDNHVKFEFEDKDVEPTMKTMVKESYVHHVPVMTGGVGYNGVYDFYKNDFAGKMPKDTKDICN